jgi:hypothetical protein
MAVPIDRMGWGRRFSVSTEAWQPQIPIERLFVRQSLKFRAVRREIPRASVSRLRRSRSRVE